MAQLPIADKTTLDTVNTKIGASTDTANASGTTGFGLWKFLTSTWTAAKAAFLDVAVSSRADSADLGTRTTAASGTVNTTNTIMAYVKYLVTTLATVASNVTSLKNNPPSVIKQIIRGTATFGNNKTEQIVTLPTSLIDVNKCVVLINGTGYNSTVTTIGFSPYLKALTNTTATFGHFNGQSSGYDFSYQIIEFN